MSQPIIHVDLLSQPCRTIVSFCELSKIDYQRVNLSLGKGENRTAEYLAKFNDFSQLPSCSLPNGLNFVEGFVIAKHLATSQQKFDLYPVDEKRRIQLDSYLDWHHEAIRQAGRYVFNTVVYKMFKVPQNQTPEQALTKLKGGLQVLNDKWLGGADYINREKNLTLADLAAFNELLMLEMSPFPTELWNSYPNIKAWMQRMEQNPQVSKETKTYRDIIASL